MRLYHQLMLLSLDSYSNKPPRSARFQLTLAAAVYADLFLQEHLLLAEDTRLEKSASTMAFPNEPILHRAMVSADEHPRRKLSAHISKMASLALRTEMLAELVEIGHLKEKREDVFWIFSRRSLHLQDGKLRDGIIQSIRDALFNNKGTGKDHLAALIALAEQSKMLERVLPYAEYDQAKPQIENIVRGDDCSNAVKQALKAIDAGLTAAIVTVSAANVG